MNLIGCSDRSTLLGAAAPSTGERYPTVALIPAKRLTAELQPPIGGKVPASPNALLDSA